LLWISRLVLEFIDNIEVDFLAIEESGNERALQLRGKVEDGRCVVTMGFEADVRSQGSSQARFANAGRAVEQHEFTLRENFGDEPGLFSGRLIELKSTRHGMLHKKNGLWAWYVCIVMSGFAQ